MNAAISAGDYDTSKRDMNEKLHSLAFKMQNVYNLDKKKGPPSDVYKFFINTFGKDIQ